jgi:endonuclease/exonuclease/phosphatase family metal-dependent hydrolase
MSQIKLASWNVARRLSDPGRDKADAILRGIEQLDADVLVLSEAAAMSGRQVCNAAIRFGELGYRIAGMIEYQDQVPHPSERQYLQVLTRLGAVAVKDITLATRQAAEITISGRPNQRAMRGIGWHQDDRSEQLRHGISVAALREDPDFLIGDANTHDPRTLRARMFRSKPGQILANHIPHARYRSLAQRNVGMAQGNSYATLTEWGGFVTANPKHIATKTVAGVPFSEVDHFLYRPDRVTIENFTVHNLIAGSDHYPISVDISPAA